MFDPVCPLFLFPIWYFFAPAWRYDNLQYQWCAGGLGKSFFFWAVICFGQGFAKFLAIIAAQFYHPPGTQSGMIRHAGEHAHQLFQLFAAASFEGLVQLRSIVSSVP